MSAIISLTNNQFGTPKISFERVPVADPYRTSSSWGVEVRVNPEKEHAGVPLSRSELAAIAAAIQQHLKDTQEQ